MSYLVYLSLIDPTENKIVCGVCTTVSNGQEWGTVTDLLGNNWGTCPLCMNESLLVNDEEYPSNVVRG